MSLYAVLSDETRSVLQNIDVDHCYVFSVDNRSRLNALFCAAG